MAHTKGPSARTQRLTALVAMCAIATATAFAFGRVFLGHGSTWRLLAVGLASALVASALERRNLVLATVVSAACMTVAVGLLVFPHTTWHGLPTLETLRHSADASRLVGEQARVQVSPTPPLAPLLLAGVTAMWAAVFSSHALAFRAGSPLLALLPPVALLAFADTVLEDLVKPFYGVAFLAAALAVVFADALRRVQAWGPIWAGAGSRAHLGRTASRGARRVGAAALVMATFMPVLVPGFGSKAIVDLSTNPSDARVRIDPLVSIKDSLTRSDPIEVFRVATNHPSYWRLLSLPDFDGSTWRPDPETNGEPITPTTQLTPAGPPGSQTIDQAFTISHDLGVPWLPAAYPPQRVDLPTASATFHPEDGSIISDDSISAGTRYRVTSTFVDPTPGQLASEQLGPEQLATDPQFARYTHLPGDLPPEIGQIARQWTGGLTNDYAMALAIQDRLTASPFRYDENVPARDDSFTILDFLTKTRAGFCQQFASTMAVMLRTLGIPSRVAVGFTAGTYDPGTNTRVVTTQEAHSWVEVLFPDFGWLAFEPTPGRLNPVASSYQQVTPECATNPAACESNGASGSTIGPGRPLGAATGLPGQLEALLRSRNERQPLPSRFAREPAATGQTQEVRRVPWRPALAIALLGAAILLLLIPPVRVLRRRWRLRRAHRAPRTLILATYDVFTERAADLGYPRSRGETLEEYRRRLATGGLTDGNLDRLTAIAARAAYAPDDPAGTDAAVASHEAAAAIRALRKRAGLARRMAGLYRLTR